MTREKRTKYNAIKNNHIFFIKITLSFLSYLSIHIACKATSDIVQSKEQIYTLLDGHTVYSSSWNKVMVFNGLVISYFHQYITENVYY